MSRILVLGATGKLAGIVAGKLAGMPGVDLRLASSREAGREALAKRFVHADVVLADWYDEASLVAAMRGVDRVLFITPDTRTDEAIVTPNVIRAAKTAGSIAQIVRLVAIPQGMTTAALPPEFAATRAGAAMHLVARPLLDASGLPVTYLNVPCWIMFNLGWFIAPEVRARRRIAMPAGCDAPRHWVSEDDIADAATRLLCDPAVQHAGREYVLTARERVVFSQLAGFIAAALGEPVAFVEDEAPLRAAMGSRYANVVQYLRLDGAVYGGVVATETIRKLLGRPPETLPEYLRRKRALFIP